MENNNNNTSRILMWIPYVGIITAIVLASKGRSAPFKNWFEFIGTAVVQAMSIVISIALLI